VKSGTLAKISAAVFAALAIASVSSPSNPRNCAAR